MKHLRDAITTVLIALVIFILLQVTVGSFKVYGLCMLPNIQHGDYIMVNKTSYLFQNPERGEVIIFHSPRNRHSDLIKRIIAIPGDTIEIKDNKVFVNGTALVESYIMESPNYELPRQKIPTDHYFVLGDNRNNSADSHTGWLLPRGNIIGKAWVCYWPLPHLTTIEHYAIDTIKQ